MPAPLSRSTYVALLWLILGSAVLYLLEWLEVPLEYVLPLAILLFGGLLLYAARMILDARERSRPGRRFQSQLAMLALTAIILLALILFLPLSEKNKSLLGLILSAAIALASTSVLGNVMGGLTLRALRNFKVGDFIRCDSHFGRVTERGLTHTEIQTEDRDLTTIPNQYLTTNPIKVIRSSGTIVSATVSLGYDVPHAQIRELLTAAAAEADLEEPFVQIRELGDFSVTYRVAGLLKEAKGLISRRSRLRRCMLDALHGGGIEIVSPTFMNQRRIASEDRFVPPIPAVPAAPEEEARFEEVAFDKAEQAESLEDLRVRYAAIAKEREELAAQVKEADEAARPELEQQGERIDVRLGRLKALIEARETELQEDDAEG